MASTAKSDQLTQRGICHAVPYCRGAARSVDKLGDGGADDVGLKWLRQRWKAPLRMLSAASSILTHAVRKMTATVGSLA